MKDCSDDNKNTFERSAILFIKRLLQDPLLCTLNKAITILDLTITNVCNTEYETLFHTIHTQISKYNVKMV